MVPSSKVMGKASDQDSHRSREILAMIRDDDQVLQNEPRRKAKPPSRRLPKHGIAHGLKRVAGNGNRLGPRRLSFQASGSINRRIPGVFSVAAIVGRVEVPVIQNVECRRVLVETGIHFRAQHSFHMHFGRLNQWHERPQAEQNSMQPLRLPYKRSIP